MKTDNRIMKFWMAAVATILIWASMQSNVFATTILNTGDSIPYKFDTGLPVDWAIIDNTGNGGWRFDDPGIRGNLTGGNTLFAIADSDYTGTTMDTELRTQSFNMSALSSAGLEFKTDFYSSSGNEIADVDVSIDGGTNWSNVWQKTGADYRGPATETIDLTAYAGQSDVMIRFHYWNANFDWYWQVDDVRIYSVCSGTLDKQLFTSPFASTTPGTIAVTSGCAWTATSNSPWITITSSPGVTPVQFEILPGSELIGSLTIAGQNVVVKHTGIGGLDSAFTTPDGYVTTPGTDQEKATILYPANAPTIFYKVSVEGSNYTIQRRNISDGTPSAGSGDGSLTGGFDSQGRVILPTIAGYNSYPTKAALQSDGKIVIIGYPDIYGTSFELLRLGTDGILDSTFGTTGYHSESYFGTVESAFIAVIPTSSADFDKIVVGVNTGGSDVSVVRYTPNGSTDSTSGFGDYGEGIHTTTIGSTYLNDMALDPNSKILLAGYNNATATVGWLMSLNANGTENAAFDDTAGHPGYITFSNGNWDSFNSVVVQPNGYILVTGESDDASSPNGTGFLSVLRYTDAGLLDSANFATTALTPGVLLHGGADIGGSNFYDYGASIAVQPNGKIVVGGAEWNIASSSAAATFLRLKSDGSFDTGFGYNGATSFGYLNNWFEGVVNAINFQPDGKQISAGYIGANNYTLRQTSGSPKIDITPVSPYNFGSLFLPVSQSIVVTIRNNGESPLNVSNITLAGSSAYTLVLSWDYSPVCDVTNPKLNPGESCGVLVNFTPTIPGTPSATLTVTSDDPAATTADLVFNSTIFTAPPYTVTYNSNTGTGGTVPTDGNSYQNGASVTVLGNTGALAKTGYSFNGWNSAANGSGTPYAAAATFSMGSANVTLYAQWTALPTYTVTYDSNTSTGGTVPTDSNNYLTGASVTVLANSGTLLKTGYTFNGWNTVANGSGTAQAAASTFSMGSTNVTLYAQWTALPTYTVTYDSNTSTGGNVPTDSNNYLSGASVTVLGNSGTLVKSGYTFNGWNSAANGSGTAYAATATFSMGSANVTLYAQWTALPTYTATYNGNTSTGGTVPTDSNNYLTGTSVTVLANSGTLTKTGYTFNGWNTAANGSGTVQAVASTFSMGSANVTLHAQWTALPTSYTVTYNGNTSTGGTVPTDSNNYLTGATVTVLGNSGTLVKSGYTFNGWNTAANGSGTAQAAASTFSMPSANVTLYAQWTALPTYTVTYNGNTSTGGTVPTDSNNYLSGASVTVLGNSGTLVKSGYTFNGWNSAANGSGTAQTVASTFNMASANVTLYAQWSLVPHFSITFVAGPNGTVSGTTSQVVDYGTSTTAVTAASNIGYHFVNWSGTGGFVTTTSNPLTVANITAEMAITANFELDTPIIDTTAPVVTGFSIPASPNLSVTNIMISATDNVGVTGYLVSENSATPSLSDSTWTATAPATYTFRTWGNNILYAFAKDAAGNISVAKSAVVLIGPTDGILVPPTGVIPIVVVPQLADALKSLNFAMKLETPTEAELLHGDVAPLVNGIPHPDGEINLGDTIVILRRVVGL